MQEWLWCETWCGNATKAKAKTIDLCNNPLTKEPKLDSARRIVAEWPGIDSEVAAFTAKVLPVTAASIPLRFLQFRLLNHDHWARPTLFLFVPVSWSMITAHTQLCSTSKPRQPGMHCASCTSRINQQL